MSEVPYTILILVFNILRSKYAYVYVCAYVGIYVCMYVFMYTVPASVVVICFSSVFVNSTTQQCYMVAIFHLTVGCPSIYYNESRADVAATTTTTPTLHKSLHMNKERTLCKCEQMCRRTKKKNKTGRKILHSCRGKSE